MSGALLKYQIYTPVGVLSTTQGRYGSASRVYAHHSRSMSCDNRACSFSGPAMTRRMSYSEFSRPGSRSKKP